MSVCPSVCLAVSHTGILSKQLNTSSNFISLRVATPFQFFNTKRHGNNIIILHTLVKLVKSHYCLFVCSLILSFFYLCYHSYWTIKIFNISEMIQEKAIITVRIAEPLSLLSSLWSSWYMFSRSFSCNLYRVYGPDVNQWRFDVILYRSANEMRCGCCTQ